jgi:hypothetical protein
MKTKTIYICDRCERMIMPCTNYKPNGFILEGNIYAAEEGEGGLVGSNKEIGKQCYCKLCFIEMLDLEDSINEPAPVIL